MNALMVLAVAGAGAAALIALGFVAVVLTVRWRKRTIAAMEQAERHSGG
ncbi:hypothetical protein [Streptomyces violascens]|nr:hypothetical protein [Streptomyces violascens]